MPSRLGVKMAKNKRGSAEAKFKIVLEVLRGDKTLNEISQRYEVAPTQVSAWKRWHQALDYKTPSDVSFSTENDEPLDRCTSLSGRLAPCGMYGQVVDNASALPTT